MFAKASSVAVIGMDAHPVEVEVQVAQGLPAFTVVGLPDAAIQESRERVRAAVQSSGEQWPMRRLTVNLSPAHIPKTGSGFDLAIALGVLAAAGRVPEARLRRYFALGELSLDGAVRRIRGVLAGAIAAARTGRPAVMVPRGNAAEATLIDGVEVIPIDTLAQAVRYLRGECSLDAATPTAQPQEADAGPDLAEVRGQKMAKRAMEVAAAGGHNVLMTGPPGGGKTMLARRLPSILPPLGREEALEVTRIYSVAGLLPDEAQLIVRRPFRAPHHTVSTPGLVGGGSGIPSPGEVSLAHRGVLFLDEASEFRRDALQSLRGPIEDGEVTVVRARVAVTYPSRFQLVAATNPCPCGHLEDPVKPCTCAPGQLSSYSDRLSGAILDRIDLQIEVPRLARRDIFEEPAGDPSAAVRGRVVAARDRQRARLARLGLSSNAEIPARALDGTCRLSSGARRRLEGTVESLALSMRGAHRLIRVARTVADLEGVERVDAEHVIEAAQLRVRKAPR
jgi:magnesium chelatase family protein